MITTTQTYTQVKNKPGIYIPINIVPSNIIKCTHCDAYVHYEKFQQHCESHVPGKFRDVGQKGSVVSKGVGKGKIDFRGMLDMEESQEEIIVRSLLPDQLPSVQEKRQQAKILVQSVPELKSSTSTPSLSILKCTQSAPIQQPDTLHLQSSTQAQCQTAALTFKKPINISLSTKELTKTKLNYYQNRKPLQTSLFANNVIIKAKNYQEYPEQESQLGKQNDEVYYIEPIVKKKEKLHIPVRVEVNSTLKQPKYHEKISPISTSTGTGQGFFKKQFQIPNLNLNSKFAQSFIATDRKPNSNTCPECHGFYCSTCKSDIPPIYRQMPNNQAQFLNSDSRAFYASHVHNRSHVGKTSRMTGCTNCQ